MSKDLAPIGPMMLRVPTFPLATLYPNIKASEIAELGVRGLLRERMPLFDVTVSEFLDAAITVASPTLYQQIVRFRENSSTGDKPVDRKLLHSMIRYVIRMSARSTPFGLFAATGAIEVGNDTNLLIADLRTESFGNSEEIEKRLTETIDTCKTLGILRLIISPLVYMRGQYIYYQHPNPWHTIGTERFNADSVDRELYRVSQSRKTVPEIKRSILEASENRESEDEVDARIEWWISQKLLIDTIRPGIDVSDGRTELYRRTSEEYPDLPMPAKTSQRGMPWPLSGSAAPESVADLKQFSDQAAGIHVDTYARLAQNTLSRAEVQRLSTAIASFSRLNYWPKSSYIALINLLSSTAGSSFVPLTYLSETTNALGLAVRDIALKRGEYYSETRSEGSSLIDEIILEGWGVDEIALDQSQALNVLEAHSTTPAIAGSAFIVSKKSGDSCEALSHWIMGVVPGSGFEMMGRFSHGEPLWREVLANLQQVDSTEVPVELFRGACNGRRDVTLRNPSFENYISLDNAIQTKGKRIAVEDVFLRYSGRKIDVYARGVGYIKIHHTTAANWKESSNDLAYWLLALTSEPADMWYSASPEVRKLSHTPRLLWKGHLLLPRQWRLGKSLINSLSQATGTARFVEFREWWSQSGVPGVFEIGRADRFARLNIDDVEAIEAHWSYILSPDNIIRESFAAGDEIVKDSQGNGYPCEIIMPFRSGPSQPPLISSNIQDKIEAAERSITGDLRRATSQSWLYLKVYSADGRGDDVLERIVMAICAEELKRNAAGWYFVQYGYPSFHFRVRVKYGNSVEAVESIERISATLAREAGTSVTHWHIDTFEPDVLRYGGLEGFDVCEKVFFADATYCMSLRAIARNVDIDDQPLFFKSSAALIALRLCETLASDADRALALAESLHSKYRKSSEVKGSRRRGAAIQAAVRNLRGLSSKEATTAFAMAERASEKWYASTASSLGELLELSRRQRLTIELDDIFASLVHLMCNRVLPRWSGEDEAQIVEIVVKAMKAQRFASSRPIERETSYAK